MVMMIPQSPQPLHVPEQRLSLHSWAQCSRMADPDAKVVCGARCCCIPSFSPTASAKAMPHPSVVMASHVAWLAASCIHACAAQVDDADDEDDDRWVHEQIRKGVGSNAVANASAAQRQPPAALTAPQYPLNPSNAPAQQIAAVAAEGAAVLSSLVQGLHRLQVRLVWLVPLLDACMYQPNCPRCHMFLGIIAKMPYKYVAHGRIFHASWQSGLRSHRRLSHAPLRYVHFLICRVCSVKTLT